MALSVIVPSVGLDNGPGLAAFLPPCIQRRNNAARAIEKYRVRIRARDRFASTQTSA
jgi:hypothetical protein